MKEGRGQRLILGQIEVVIKEIKDGEIRDDDRQWHILKGA